MVLKNDGQKNGEKTIGIGQKQKKLSIMIYGKNFLI